jgi:hypothetical protein
MKRPTFVVGAPRTAVTVVVPAMPWPTKVSGGHVAETVGVCVCVAVLEAVWLCEPVPLGDKPSDMVAVAEAVWEAVGVCEGVGGT